MSTRTYTTKIHGHEVALKLKKDLAKIVCKEIESACKVPGNWIELTGIIGGDEHRSQLWTPFGGAPVTVVDPEGYAADVAALLDGLPELIDETNAREVIASARAVFVKHLPVEDLRTTPEVHAAEVEDRNAKIQEHEDERAAFLVAHVAQYGDSPDPIEVPEGYTSVVIELNYNDSDSQSDYFDRHHSYGPQYLLALVKGRPARTEKLHRDIIARYPELAALPWTWNTENYSMGHGNWLESDSIGTAEDVISYGGVTAPAVWWEVSYGWNKKVYPFRGYARSQAPRPANVETPAAPAIIHNGKGYEVTHERDWTWVKFPSKPTPEVLDTLRSNGGRWGKRRQAWYFTRTISETEVSRWLGYGAPDPEPVTESQLDHCTDLVGFLKEYNEKFPAEKCEVIEYGSDGYPKPEHTEILIPAEVWLAGESEPIEATPEPAPIEVERWGRYALYDDD